MIHYDASKGQYYKNPIREIFFPISVIFIRTSYNMVLCRQYVNTAGPLSIAYTLYNISRWLRQQYSRMLQMTNTKLQETCFFFYFFSSKYCFYVFSYIFILLIWLITYCWSIKLVIIILIFDCKIYYLLVIKKDLWIMMVL